VHKSKRDLFLLHGMTVTGRSEQHFVGMKVVISRAFSFFLLKNHFINKNKIFSFSCNINYEANFPFFFAS
jgi:hypothetical protein